MEAENINAIGTIIAIKKNKKMQSMTIFHAILFLDLSLSMCTSLVLFLGELNSYDSKTHHNCKENNTHNTGFRYVSISHGSLINV